MENESQSENIETKEDKVVWNWASTVPEGIPPSSRGGHTATLIGKSVIVFGGHFYKDKNTGFVYLNDLYFLDIGMSKWLVTD